MDIHMIIKTTLTSIYRYLHNSTDILVYRKISTYIQTWICPVSKWMFLLVHVYLISKAT